MKDEILQQFKLIFEVMGSDEFTDTVATFCWNLYTKLKAKGFTDDQAIRLVTSMNNNKK